MRTTRCNKCLIPASYPGANINSEGTCSFCVDYEKRYRDWDQNLTKNKKKFDRLLSWAKRKNRQYDALVPLSGGKDSMYVLYLAVMIYKLKVLCYNFDNGFRSDIAKENIKNAIEKTGADLLTLSPGENVIMRLYKHFFKHTGMVCPVCMRGITAGQFAVTRLFAIPLVLQGSSLRTEENVTAEIFQDGSLSFFRNVLKKHPAGIALGFFGFDRTLWEKFLRGIFLISKRKVKVGCINIQVPEYFDWDYKLIYRTIKKEMGWKELPDRDEHVDCVIDPAVHYMRKLRIPAITPNVLRYCSEIRAGQITRDKALGIIEKEEKDRSVPAELKVLLKKLNLTISDFQTYMEDPFRHMKYQTESLRARIVRKVRNGSL